MKYRIGPLSISSSSAQSSQAWRSAIQTFLSHACSGMEATTVEACKMHIVFHDYAHRPLLEKASVVPANLEYTHHQLHDLRLKVLYDFSYKHKLHIWTTGKDLSLPFIMQLALMRIGATLVHAAAISVNNAGILLPAFGGIGKTSLMAALMQQRQTDIKLLGDDIVILEEDGTLWPYPRPFCIYPYHRSLFPSYFKKNRWPQTTSWKLSYKIAREFLRAARLEEHLTRYLTDAPFITIPPANLFGEQALAKKSVPLTHVIQMEKVAGLEHAKVQALTPDHAATFMNNVMFRELRDTMHLLFALATAHKIPLAQKLSQTQTVLTHALATIPLHALTHLQIPEHTTQEAFLKHVIPYIMHVITTIKNPAPKQKLPRTPSQQAQ